MSLSLLRLDKDKTVYGSGPTMFVPAWVHLMNALPKTIVADLHVTDPWWLFVRQRTGTRIMKRAIRGLLKRYRPQPVDICALESPSWSWVWWERKANSPPELAYCRIIMRWDIPMRMPPTGWKDWRPIKRSYKCLCDLEGKTDQEIWEDCPRELKRRREM